MWYTVGPPMPRADARDRSTLVAYFLTRHAHGERLRLTSFKYNGRSGTYGNFEYTLIRRANDLPATTYAGKGAAFCQPGPGQLFV